MQEEKLFTLEEAMNFLKIGRTNMYYLRRDDETFPKPIKIVGSPRFVLSDILNWVESKKEEVKSLDKQTSII